VGSDSLPLLRNSSFSRFGLTSTSRREASVGRADPGRRHAARIWSSGDGSRVYVALENGGAVVDINTTTNKVITSIPIGQTAQARSMCRMPYRMAAAGRGTSSL